MRIVVVALPVINLSKFQCFSILLYDAPLMSLKDCTAATSKLQSNVDFQQGSSIMDDEIQTTELRCCEMKGLFSLCLFSSHHSVCFHLQFSFFYSNHLWGIQTGYGNNEMHEEEKERMRWRVKVVCGGVMFQEIHTASFPGGPCRGLFTPLHSRFSLVCLSLS